MIALGRLMLATLFSLATWFGSPSPPPIGEALALSAYMVFASVMLAATWTDWWRDARLGGPAHAVDIVVFTFLMASTEGYASPFFTFFIFILLSSAIRWGWRATTLTAMLVGGLYVLAGQIVGTSGGEFDVQPFVLRVGHLVILSLILIWFGINQWRFGVDLGVEDLLPEAALDQPQFEASLRAAMQSLGARRGAFVWRGDEDSAPGVWIGTDGEVTAVDAPAGLDGGGLTGPLLYDCANDRALARDSQRSLRRCSPRELLGGSAAALHLSEGLAIPVRSGIGKGELFLEEVDSLSTDHLDYGERLALEVATHMQRHALLKAVEESAEARSRLALARDLHDSVVQFLAGAAFRLEALKRTKGSGRDLEPDLNELKDLMLQEQGELRSFIAALRSGSRIGVDELAKDLQALSARLARQWKVLCNFSAETTEMTIPGRLHIDAQQLLREAVANAVRHAGARRINIKLLSRPGALQLEVVNDGARYPTSPVDGQMPRSLQERVEVAGGKLEISRGMNITKLSLSIPVPGRLH